MDILFLSVGSFTAPPWVATAKRRKDGWFDRRTKAGRGAVSFIVRADKEAREAELAGRRLPRDHFAEAAP